jgi:hypothetical protein
MIENAPVVLFVAGDTRLYGYRHEAALDAGNFAALASFAAWDLGYGATEIYQSDLVSQRTLRREFGIHRAWYVFVALAIGSTDRVPHKPPRPDVHTVTRWRTSTTW